MLYVMVVGIIICITGVVYVPYIQAQTYEEQINKLSGEMAEKITRANKQRVAVVDFTDLEGNVTQLGRLIAEEFSVALAGAGKGFRVVDRTHLNSIIKENKLSATGLIDPKTARELGKFAGVEALITGTIVSSGDNIRITIKILDTETAEIIDATAGNLAKTEHLATLEKMPSSSSSDRLSPKPSNTPTPTLQEQQKIVSEGFAFDLQECKRLGSNVSCYFLVTSLMNDQWLRLYADRGDDWRSRMFDDQGNEYTAKEVQLGRGENRSSGSVDNTLVKSVPVKASVSFEGIGSQTNQITLLEMRLEKSRIQFHNIPLSQ